MPIETAAVTLLTLMAAGAGEPTDGLMVMTVRTCADDDRLLTLQSCPWDVDGYFRLN